MRKFTGPLHVAVNAWFAFGAALHFHYAGFGFPEPLRLAGLHLLLFLPPIFLLFPARRGSVSAAAPSTPTAIDCLLAFAALLPSLYIIFNINEIYNRSAFLDDIAAVPLVLGTLMIALIIEAVRRSLSGVLAALIGLALGYMMVCHTLPGIWYYRNIPFPQVVEAQFLVAGSGIYGSLTNISATIIATFLVFGAFLQASGVGRLFMNIGLFAAGRFSGGPAKVVVLESGLFGITSGSSVANVVVTGSITIPEMKRIGFSAETAGGIETAASVGGLIMPPVMGAAAFVMSEITGTPYSAIVVAAIIPALLYYFGILVTVHFEGRRMKIPALPRERLPTARDVLKDCHLLIPLIVLVGLLGMRYSPYYAAFWATLSMLPATWLKPRKGLRFKDIFNAFAEAGRTIAMIVGAIAAAGIITAAMTQTGLLIACSGIIRAIAGDSFLTLTLLLAVACLIMGMGIPTTPAYIITAAIGAPVLIEHGVSTLAAHMFVFYFAVLADVTPPVSAASFAAAAIGGGSPIRTGLQALRFALAGFLCGIAVVYEPSILLNGPLSTSVLTALAIGAGMVPLAAGLTGFAEARIPLWLRPLLIAFGCFVGLAHNLDPALRLAFGVPVVLALFIIPHLNLRRAFAFPFFALAREKPELSEKSTEYVPLAPT
ncbi:MAG: TRAP transporter fused permease subunit [Methylobacteriaceae bacterium]|jgi:TRAP transporter 4TM/12TM fusion protein|nr:TRAP transporter fused permease subunit [Methylobacteriaceae bacterium]